MQEHLCMFTAFMQDCVSNTYAYGILDGTLTIGSWSCISSGATFTSFLYFDYISSDEQLRGAKNQHSLCHRGVY